MMLAGANFTPIFCEGTNGPHAGAVVTLRYGPVRFSGIAVFQRLMSPVRTGTVFPAPVRYGTPLYKRVYPYHAPPTGPVPACPREAPRDGRGHGHGWSWWRRLHDHCRTADRGRTPINAEHLLEHAADIVTGRRREYGEPADLFRDIAKRWSLYWAWK